MLLTITSETPPATDLGYLLHKDPARVQTFALSFGEAHVFYPEAGEERCTAALLLDVDPIGLVRRRKGPAGEGFSLRQYVNDRPYVASSFLSVAIAQVFGSALGGRSKERPELAQTTLPLRAGIAVLPCRGGEEFLHRLFEPLGYEVTAEQLPLDTTFPEWGESSYFSVVLTNEIRLAELLSHLYVLMPVLDNDKHYWVGQDELDKLLRKGEGWLGRHPEREFIAARYLKHQRSLATEALERLAEEDPTDPDEAAESHGSEEEEVENTLLPASGGAPEPSAREGAEDATPETRTVSTRAHGLTLAQQRHGAVLAVLKASSAATVLDLGGGGGKLLQALLDEPSFERIVGVDVSYRALEVAASRLKLDRLPPMKRQRIELLHGSLTYRDGRLSGFDAAAVVEVIEHLDPPRLAAFERVLFEFARPRTVVITTPNVEFNVMWETLPAGQFRHRDHRFEWTRAEFESWAGLIVERFGYEVRFLAVGPVDAAVGSPTQMGVFRLSNAVAN